MILSRILSVAKFMLLVSLLVVFYDVVDYFRLQSLPAKQIDYVQSINTHTDHYPHSGYSTDFIPKKIELQGTFGGTSNELKYMGTHKVCVLCWLKGFDPDHPAGYMTWKGKIVGYFYAGSDSDVVNTNYHWHRHNNLCLMEGLGPTTEYTPLQCIMHGYFYFPTSKWMLHYWVIPNPEGMNEMYNPLLQ